MDKTIITRLNDEAAGAGVGLGSDEYYASRFASPQIRYPAWCVLALKTTIEEIPLKVSDPGVARLKLAWWQDENSRINHPLLKIGEQLGLESDLLHSAVASLSALLDREYAGTQWEDDATKHEWFNAAYTNLYQLMGVDTALAIRLEESRSLLRLRDQLLVNICRFPNHKLTRYGIDLEGLLGSAQQNARQQLILEELTGAAANLKEALTERAERRGPLATYATLTLQRLNETIADGGQLLARKVDLTALRKIGIAWRCRWF